MTQEQLDAILQAIAACAPDEPYVVKPPPGRSGKWLYVQGGSVRVLTPYDSRNGPLPDDPNGVDTATWDAMSRDAGGL